MIAATSMSATGMVHSSSRRIDRPLRRKQVASLHEMLADRKIDDAAAFSERMQSLHRISINSFRSIDMSEKVTTEVEFQKTKKVDAKPEQSLPVDQRLPTKPSPIFAKLFLPFFVHKPTRKF
jgi:hypothetical protein